MYVCMYVYNVCMCDCVCVYTHIYIRVCICMYVHIYTSIKPGNHAPLGSIAAVPAMGHFVPAPPVAPEI